MTSPVIIVTDQLSISKVQYFVSPSSITPRKYDGQVEFPSKISSIKQATDDHYIHFGVSAGFVKSTSERPAQVSVSLKRKTEGSVSITN